MNNKERREYTPLAKATTVCVVTTIEIVSRLSDARDLTDFLDQARAYSAADVVDQKLIADSFDEAAAILRTRAKTDLPVS